MENKAKEELEELIKEGEKFKLNSEGHIIASSLFFTYYARGGQDQENYIKWSELLERFIRMYYPEEGDNFREVKKSMLTLHGLNRLLSMLEAIKRLPQRIEKKEETRKRSGDTHIHNNINQSQNQSQEQIQSQKLLQEIFIEAIKDDLTGKQQKELRAIIDEHKDDVEKAKPKLVNKILSFGKDVASNILANILTNPNMIGQL